MQWFPGWTTLPTDHRDPRWDAVKDERIAPIVGIKTLGGAHRYIRGFMEYRPDEGGDEWTGPNETLARGYGDCEDLALLERAILISIGVPDSEIWFVLVNDLITKQVHAMLVVDGQLLDSRSDRIQPIRQAMDYAPIEAFCNDATVVFGRIVRPPAA